MRLAPLALASVLAVACRTPTQLTIEVRTDLDCRTINETSITVGTLGPELETRPPVTLTKQCVAGRIGALVAVPSGDRGAEIGLRIVSALDGKSTNDCVKSNYAGGCIVARRAVHFLPHTELTMPIDMRADCRDVPCGVTQTCVKGACLSATIDDAHRCEGAGCDETVLAGSGTGPFPIGPIAPMAEARSEHTATILPGQKVLVVGGTYGAVPAEVLDLRTGTWSSLATDVVPANLFGGVALAFADGHVLIVGGGNDTTDFDTVFSFDPTTQTFSAAGKLGVPRYMPGVAFLDGEKRVLIAGGGRDTTCLATAEIYDVETKTSTPAPPMTTDHCRARAASIGPGRVLVFGGHDVAEVYDAASSTWTPTTVTSRFWEGFAQLVDGTVLRAADASFDRYFPATGTWTTASLPLDVLRAGPTLTALSSGGAILTGGGEGTRYSQDVLAFDPVTGTFAAVGSLRSPRIRAAGVALPGGKRVLIIGGIGPTRPLEEIVGLP